jgi:hypothetical protein
MRIDPTLIDEVRRLREEGLSYKQISDRTGVCKSTVSYHCNLEWHSRYRKLDATKARFRRERRVRRKTIDGWINASILRLKYRADKKGVPFTLTRKYLRKIYPDDNKCPVLGVEFELGNGMSPYSPSVDRLKPERGYVKGNVAVICHRANAVKHDASWEEILEVAAWTQAQIESKIQVET